MRVSCFLGSVGIRHAWLGIYRQVHVSHLLFCKVSTGHVEQAADKYVRDVLRGEPWVEHWGSHRTAQHAFDGQDVADRMDKGEDVKLRSLTRVKILALLNILEPALFKNALAEEMETIKIEKTRTADLEILMG